MAYPPVVIVNEQDQVVGSAALGEAWKKGLIHRIALVIVEDSQGRILLHKRAPTMQLYAGRWDTVGGHVDVTPDYLQTAKLELEEEVGIIDVTLREVARIFSDDPYDNGVRARRFITIYHAYSDKTPTHMGKDEVVAVRWFTKDEVAAMVRDCPERIAEGLYRCLPYILMHTKISVAHLAESVC
ncbi:MAG TPA: NUDIX domain-containing protein [Candidatus Saccharimonadales bacterium]|nr:NUDIX domain-containing protein [Candidatus Saccharimonadales bacterium]